MGQVSLFVTDNDSESMRMNMDNIVNECLKVSVCFIKYLSEFERLLQLVKKRMSKCLSE